MNIVIYFKSGSKMMFAVDNMIRDKETITLIRDASIIAEFQLAHIAGWGKMIYE